MASRFDPGKFDLSSPALTQLADVFAQASDTLPEGYRVVVTSAKRPGARVGGGGGVSQHALGDALDLQIVGPKGPVPNQGPDTSKLYGQLDVGARQVIASQYPGLVGKLGWGGHFGITRGSTAQDLMHWDLAGERGSLVPGGGMAVAAASNALTSPVGPGGPLGPMPDFSQLAAVQGSAAGNALVPQRQAFQPFPEGAPAPAGVPSGGPSPVAMMALAMAGTHRFVPVTYDPFKVMPQVDTGPAHVSALPGVPPAPDPLPAPSVSMPAQQVAVNKVSTPPSGSGLGYITRTGMRDTYLMPGLAPGGSSATASAMDPAMQNLIAGIS